MSFTPGPWLRNKTDIYTRLNDSDIYEGYVGEAATEDDATLIASAPDMLAALKLVSEYIEQPKETGIDLYGVFGLHATKVREAVASAIAKATGGQS